MFYFLNSNVKFLRKQANMTQPELAEKLNVSKSTISNFESGQINTSIEILDKLHQIFNISLEELIYKDFSKNLRTNVSLYLLNNLKYLTKTTEVNQNQLASELGTSVQSINRMLENTNLDPKTSTLIKISKIYNISIDDLIFKDLQANQD